MSLQQRLAELQDELDGLNNEEVMLQNESETLRQ